MAENENLNSLGKKIFFVHPSAFAQNHIISELAQEEFEVYILKDESKLRIALLKYPDSIVFASINETIKENAWDELVRGILSSPETKGVQVGIIASPLSDESVRKKYTEQYKVQCGCTIVKSDHIEAIKQLSAVLNAVDAKGRRKYIRMEMGNEANTTVNMPFNSNFINGRIKDISVVGFSCSFDEDPGLAKNSLYGDLQLKLQSQLIKAEGIVFGSRMDDVEKVYVILFTQRVDPSVKAKIRKYIQANLQSRMDQELK